MNKPKDSRVLEILSYYGAERARAFKKTDEYSPSSRNLYSKIAEGLKAEAKAALDKEYLRLFLEIVGDDEKPTKITKHYLGSTGVDGYYPPTTEEIPDMYPIIRNVLRQQMRAAITERLKGDE